MNYDQMTQLALRGVVRDAIRRVIREDGLPGAHHFYITFLTRFAGVEIDEGLAKKYPEEITIVLEHQFWDLNAYADEFEVTLKFGGIPKYLKVPYLAVTRFHDPSVGFALQFDAPSEIDPAASSVGQLRPVSNAAEGKPATIAATKKPSKAKNKVSAKKAKSNDDDTDKPDGDDDGSKVVSLDAFRKK